MAWPEIVIRADYTTPELQIPTDWTVLHDSSNRTMRSVNIHQGRQRLLALTEPGNATAVLDDRDRSMDPDLHPEVKPGVHVWIQAIVGTQPIDLFRGFARSFTEGWNQDVDAVTTIAAEDAFALLGRYEMTGDAIASLATGAHLETVLGLYGWPAPGTIPPGVTWWLLGQAGASELGTTTFLGENAQFFDTGQSTIMATNLEGNLLAHLLNVAETTERGTFYVGPSGDLIFNEKPTPFDPSIGTWGDAPGELKYAELSMRHDDDELFNDIRLTRRGDSVQSTASNVPAGTAPRTYEKTDLLFSTIGAQDSMATELLTRYEHSFRFPSQMVMRPSYDSPLWLATLGVELGSRLTVRRRPPGGGAIIEEDCLLLGVTHDITLDSWQITWDLAPAEPELDVWYLGRVGHSELGTHTILG